jgi:hypothetical protein
VRVRFSDEATRHLAEFRSQGLLRRRLPGESLPRDGHQPQDCESPRRRCAANSARPRSSRGDAQLPQCGNSSSSHSRAGASRPLPSLPVLRYVWSGHCQ